MPLQKPSKNQRVLYKPVIFRVVRRGVIQGREVILETARNHVQENPPIVQKCQSGHHLGHRIRMHICRLDCDEGALVTGILYDDLRHQPGVYTRGLQVNCPYK